MLTINGPFSIATLNYQRVWGFSQFFKQSLVSKVIADCFVATNLVLIQASSYWLVGELPKDDMDDDDVEDLEENNVEESEEEEGGDGGWHCRAVEALSGFMRVPWQEQLPPKNYKKWRAYSIHIPI